MALFQRQTKVFPLGGSLRQDSNENFIPDGSFISIENFAYNKIGEISQRNRFIREANLKFNKVNKLFTFKGKLHIHADGAIYEWYEKQKEFVFRAKFANYKTNFVQVSQKDRDTLFPSIALLGETLHYFYLFENKIYKKVYDVVNFFEKEAEKEVLSFETNITYFGTFRKENDIYLYYVLVNENENTSSIEVRKDGDTSFEETNAVTGRINSIYFSSNQFIYSKLDEEDDESTHTVSFEQLVFEDTMDTGLKNNLTATLGKKEVFGFKRWMEFTYEDVLYKIIWTDYSGIFVVRDDNEEVIAKFNAGLTPNDLRDIFSLGEVFELRGKVYFPLFVSGQVELSDGTLFRPLGVGLGIIDFNDSSLFEIKEFSEHAIFSGSFPKIYDGTNLTENSFNKIPKVSIDSADHLFQQAYSIIPAPNASIKKIGATQAFFQTRFQQNPITFTAGDSASFSGWDSTTGNILGSTDELIVNSDFLTNEISVLRSIPSRDFFGGEVPANAPDTLEFPGDGRGSATITASARVQSDSPTLTNVITNARVIRSGVTGSSVNYKQIVAGNFLYVVGPDIIKKFNLDGTPVVGEERTFSPVLGETIGALAVEGDDLYILSYSRGKLGENAFYPFLATQPIITSRYYIGAKPPVGSITSTSRDPFTTTGAYDSINRITKIDISSSLSASTPVNTSNLTLPDDAYVIDGYRVNRISGGRVIHSTLIIENFFIMSVSSDKIFLTHDRHSGSRKIAVLNKSDYLLDTDHVLSGTILSEFSTSNISSEITTEGMLIIRGEGRNSSRNTVFRTNTYIIATAVLSSSENVSPSRDATTNIQEGRFNQIGKRGNTYYSSEDVVREGSLYVSVYSFDRFFEKEVEWLSTQTHYISGGGNSGNIYTEFKFKADADNPEFKSFGLNVYNDQSGRFGRNLRPDELESFFKSLENLYLVVQSPTTGNQVVWEINKDEITIDSITSQLVFSIGTVALNDLDETFDSEITLDPSLGGGFPTNNSVQLGYVYLATHFREATSDAKDIEYVKYDKVKKYIEVSHDSTDYIGLPTLNDAPLQIHEEVIESGKMKLRHYTETNPFADGTDFRFQILPRKLYYLKSFKDADDETNKYALLDTNKNIRILSYIFSEEFEVLGLERNYYNLRQIRGYLSLTLERPNRTLELDDTTEVLGISKEEANPNYLGLNGDQEISDGKLLLHSNIRTVATAPVNDPSDTAVDISYPSSSIIVVNEAVINQTPLRIYGYRAVYKWIDARGYEHRSTASLSTLARLTQRISDNSKVTISIDNINFSEKSGIICEIYRTVDNGTTYRKLAEVALPEDEREVLFEDIERDSDVLGQVITPYLASFQPESSQVVEEFEDRFFLGGFANFKNRIIYSNPVSQTANFAPNFSSTNFIYMDGEVIAIKEMDSRLVIFTSSGIYLWAFGITIPQVITGSENIILKSKDSVTFTSKGIVFQSKKGIYILTRGLSLQYIGDPVQDFNEATVVDAIELRKSNEIRFATDTGKQLVFNYHYGKWSVFNFPLETSISYLDEAYVVSGGDLYKEDGLVKDFAIKSSFDTGYIVLGPVLEGYQLVRGFLIDGYFKKPSLIEAEVFYDNEPASRQTISFDLSKFTDDQIEAKRPFKFLLRKQKCSKIRIKFTFLAEDLKLNTLGIMYSSTGDTRVLPTSKRA